MIRNEALLTTGLPIATRCGSPDFNRVPDDPSLDSRGDAQPHSRRWGRSTGRVESPNRFGLDRMGPNIARSILVLVLASGLIASVKADAGQAPPGHGANDPRSVPVTITWAMAERFGPSYDRNRDARPDLPNSYEYINPGRYEVQLGADVAEIVVPPTDLFCAWTIDDLERATTFWATGMRPIVRLPQGTYSVTAAIRFGDGRSGSAQETIRVKDLLIVALGDSLATGEGNPEKPARWEKAGDPVGVDPPTPALWADGGPGGNQPRVTPAGVLPPASVLHIRAHRSTRAAPAQVAMRLEADDPHTSVTFVCLASTGARIVDVFVPDRSCQNRALSAGPELPAQFDELRAIAGSRPVDILILSIGFNDCRAFEILSELIRHEIRWLEPLRLLAAYATRQDWAAAAAPDIDINALVDRTELPRLEELDPDVRRKELSQDAERIYDVDAIAQNGLAATRDQLMQLGEAIAQDPLLARADVYLLEYPDPTRDGSGATGKAILDELVPGFRINRRELDLGRERLLQPLNQALREAARRRGWSYVGGIFASFGSHGYAASDTWFIRAKESEQLQGPRLGLVSYLRGVFSPGMLHPNRCGHQVIADRLYQSVVSRFPELEDH
jgi:hypothetical protein